MTDQSAVGDQGDAMVIGYHAAADRIEKEIGKPMGRVLDVGCNSGAGMRALAARWPDAILIGLEPVEHFARMAGGTRLSVICCEAEATPWPDGVFDFIFSRHSLEHCAARAAAIRELTRILRPGGRIYIQAPVEPGGTRNELHRCPFVSLEELRAAFPGLRELYWGPQPTVGELILEKP